MNSAIVRLDRRMDREKPCCGNMATLGPGKGPHAAELRCSACGRHRGWLAQEAGDFLKTITEQFGAPTEPLTLSDNSIGDHTMTDKKFDNKNTGVLFKNENKQSEKHSDYRGSVNAAGLDYWVDGWVRQSKSGAKFISFKLKLKQEQQFDVKEPPIGLEIVSAADVKMRAKPVEAKPDFDDAMPF
jgi:hypothetical protein